jgi:hypothetical protein
VQLVAQVGQPARPRAPTSLRGKEGASSAQARALQRGAEASLVVTSYTQVLARASGPSNGPVPEMGFYLEAVLYSLGSITGHPGRRSGRRRLSPSPHQRAALCYPLADGYGP